MLDSIFRLKENNTDPRKEIIAGVTTFMTISYIIFVQPAVLAQAGMDFGAVMVATILSSAFATLIMGLLANYPIALAPAMGHNFFFVFTVAGAVSEGGMGYSWQVALGAVFISGSIFLLLSFVGLRETIINAIPSCLKNAIAIGIGLLITMVGLEWSGLVVDKPGTLVGLGDLHYPPTLLSLTGLFILSILMVLRVRGAIFLSIISTTLIGIFTGLIEYRGIIDLPPSMDKTFFKLDIIQVFKSRDFFLVVSIFFFLDLFDTVGTLVGVSEEGGFLTKDGKLPRARQALLSDALGTVCGALLGTSTVTSYIESAAGIAEGGRTGLANMVTVALLLCSLFLYPLVQMVGGGYPTGGGRYLYPIIAPVLIIIGSIMLKGIIRIDWNEPTEAIPSFLTLIIMPVTFSITEGIAFGFISYSLLKAIKGRFKEVPPVIYIFAVLFVLRYLLLR